MPVSKTSCLLVTAAMACGAAPKPAIYVRRPAPDFVATAIDGTTFRLSEMRGRVVVLDIWASWCDGCERELPVIDGMARRIARLGAVVVSVAIDEDASEPLRILRRRSWAMTALYEPSGAMGDAYQPARMPMVLVIDRAGIVRDVRYALSPTDIADIERRVEDLSAASTTGGSR